jgi:hypothetical protein
MARAKKKDKHVLVRMPVELHQRIAEMAKAHRWPRSWNTELVELLYEFTDWWGDGETATDDVEGRIEALELTGRKMLAAAAVERKGRAAEAERARQKRPPEKK